MTVDKLITWLTAEAVALPVGLGSQVLDGPEDDIEAIPYQVRLCSRMAPALRARGVSLGGRGVMNPALHARWGRAQARRRARAIEPR